MSSSLTSRTSAPDARQLGLPDIAFTGKAGSGKSSAAEFMTEEFGYRRRSFAAPLRSMAAALWGEDARTDRDKLQRLGVAVRNIEPDTWANMLIAERRGDVRRFTDARGTIPPVAVDDLRFPNEYDALKGEGFVIVRVTAPVEVRKTRLVANGKWQSDEQLDHVSETALDGVDVDYTIDNDGTSADLQDALVEILIRERRRR